MYNRTHLFKGKNKKQKVLRSIVRKHPGEILRKQIEGMGMTQKEFAKCLGMFPGHLNDLINGKRAMSIPIALRLEKVLGTDPSYWMNLQIKYDIEIARHDNYIKKIVSKTSSIK